MGDKVTCTVCGDDVGRMGIGMHAGMHRREFRERYGRQPEDYQEVRDRLGAVHSAHGGEQATLWESLTDDEQATFPWGEA